MMQTDMMKIDEIMRTKAVEGPVILETQTSMMDFLIAGALQSARTIDEGIL